MRNIAATEAAVAPKSARAGKYLTFALGGEEFGIGILKVREIIGMMDITAVPQAPSYMKGVINLRGQVIGVIDLRTKFGMEPTKRTEQTCIIVAEVEEGGQKCLTGIIVDRVSEVLNIPAESIEESPRLGSGENDFILGMGKIGKSVKILLDIDRIIQFGEMSQVTGEDHGGGS